MDTSIIMDNFYKMNFRVFIQSSSNLHCVHEQIRNLCFYYLLTTLKRRKLIHWYFQPLDVQYMKRFRSIKIILCEPQRKSNDSSNYQLDQSTQWCTGALMWTTLNSSFLFVFEITFSSSRLKLKVEYHWNLKITVLHGLLSDEA